MIYYVLCNILVKNINATLNDCSIDRNTSFSSSPRNFICQHVMQNLTSLVSRRDDISHKFLLNITNPASCLHHFLHPPRSNSVTSRLKSYEYYPRPSTRTIQYCSCTQYGFSPYQHDSASIIILSRHITLQTHRYSVAW